MEIQFINVKKNIDLEDGVVFCKFANNINGIWTTGELGKVGSKTYFDREGNEWLYCLLLSQSIEVKKETISIEEMIDNLENVLLGEGQIETILQDLQDRIESRTLDIGWGDLEFNKVYKDKDSNKVGVITCIDKDENEIHVFDSIYTIQEFNKRVTEYIKKKLYKRK